MKTYRQWGREGRVPRSGEQARAYLMDDDRYHGAGLFDENQTEPLMDLVAQDTWTVQVTPAEYRSIRLEARNLKSRPKVRIDKRHAGGVSVWVGPNKAAIGWLKEAGYRFDAKSHRWCHLNKDADYVAKGFEAIPNYQVIREWADAEPQGPVI